MGYAFRWTVVCWAVTIAVLPFVPLPAPYTGRTVVAISPERLARLPIFPMDTSDWPVVKKGRLLAAQYLPAASKILGAETVAAVPGGAGDLALLDRDGMLHITAGPNHASLRSSTHIGLVGRPLGYMFDAKGRLLVCDSTAGLLRHDRTDGTTTLLANSLADGTPLRFVNALDISASSGKIYFSSATDQPVSWRGGDHLGDRGFYDTMAAAKMNLVHGSPAGRLLVYDPATGKLEVLLEKLFFANGVALAPDESFVLVCESYGARVMRVWLKGDRTGQSDVFVDRLPGFPDGISKREDGGFWVSLVNPPNILGRIAGPSPVRALLGHIMPLVEPLVKRYGCVAKVSADGTRQALLMDVEGSHVSSIASAHQQGRRLYLGNLMGAGVSVLHLEEGE